MRIEIDSIWMHAMGLKLITFDKDFSLAGQWMIPDKRALNAWYLYIDFNKSSLSLNHTGAAVVSLTVDLDKHNTFYGNSWAATALIHRILNNDCRSSDHPPQRIVKIVLKEVCGISYEACDAANSIEDIFELAMMNEILNVHDA